MRRTVADVQTKLYGGANVELLAIKCAISGMPIEMLCGMCICEDPRNHATLNPHRKETFCITLGHPRVAR